MSHVTIREIKTICTAPRGPNLVVVKILTSEPGLYGLGCATFTQRHTAVAAAIEDYLKPMLEGRSVDNIEDIWQASAGSSYWRNGPVLNNALSGVDMALWDIKGKMAGMPVYELMGGRCRTAAAVYRHADGLTPQEVEENVRSYMEQGYHYIRCQMGMYGGKNIGIPAPDGSLPGQYFDPARYMKDTLAMFTHLREVFGYDVEFVHDIHERLTPVQALGFAKDLEFAKLFFLEDALPPEQVEWFADFRRQVSVPIAMGELFNHPLEWKSLISNRLIDYIRVHISQIGGLTPARKLAALCEAFGVRTAWHGPPDISPVGMMAQLHLDVSTPNFGIQEFSGYNEQEQEVFSGCPEVRNGYLYPNDKPGFGVDIDEAAAKKYPCKPTAGWLPRLPDGTSVRP